MASLADRLYQCVGDRYKSWLRGLLFLFPGPGALSILCRLATAPFGRSGAWDYDEDGVDEAMCQKSEWLTLRLYLEPLSLGVTA